MDRMDDPIVILSAVAGGLTGLLLLLHAGRASRKEGAIEEEGAMERTTRHVVGYAATPRTRASWAPILTALGVAVLAIGLLIGGVGAGLGLLALLSGGVLLITALVVVTRQA